MKISLFKQKILKYQEENSIKDPIFKEFLFPEVEEHLKVDSTAISNLAYDKSSSTLFVEFHSKSIYMYNDVNPYIFNDLINAPSIGLFFQKEIRGDFKYKRL